ncbi:NAD(P)H-binding protein [Streptomyces sp. NBC_01235]|uniref:NAD(P)H-binding protein n=1 Tax=Streptomyces sp. NBC_01235 TaxID=2903788 RepID=UPI002E12CB4D|nr:NAD(P)H-binding protein [Streptomyces sp. NBC_01235]
MILVTGATGNIGRELTRELDTKGAKLRLLVRDPARAAGLSDRAERAVGDLGEPSTLTPAFAGVDKLFLLTQGIGTDCAAAAIAAAEAAGVSHIVHLSSLHVTLDPLPAMARWHHEREEIIRASAIPATFLRPGGFMTNAFDWLPTIREGNHVLDPVGPGRYAPIDPADIAAVAALVLTEAGHQDKEYVLTGDETFTVTEQVRVISETIGRDIEVREVTTPDEAVRFRFPNGAPQALADAVTEGFKLMRADTVGFRTDTVERLLGRKPRTFVDWCARNADAFRRPETA